AREALAEMRQMLSVLRTPEDAPDTSRRPAPGLNELQRLAQGMREAGLPLQVTIDTGSAPLAPAVDLAVYRIAQEGLTNVVRHAGRAVTSLMVAATGDQVEVRIENRPGRTAPTASSGDGHGLIGIRERVGSVGGRFTAGPSEDGGFVLRATLPARPPAPGGAP
ncbi:MAG: sensor histidine kinase, partial [Nocardioidaceae bacterium]